MFNPSKILTTISSIIIRDIKQSLNDDFKKPFLDIEFKIKLQHFLSFKTMTRSLARSREIKLTPIEIKTIINLPNQQTLINRSQRLEEKQLLKTKQIGNLKQPFVLFNRKSNKRWLIYGHSFFISLNNKSIKVLQLEC